MDGLLVSQIILAVSTLVASLGGYVLAGINERRRDERAIRRELEMRASEREARLDEAEHELQRATLIALQDALQTMARLTGKAMHFDHMHAREGRYTQLPEGLSDDLHANEVEVRRLASRVQDAGIREAVKRFTCTSVRLSTSPKDLRGVSGRQLEDQVLAKEAEFGGVYDEVSQLVGEAVRAEIAWRPRASRASATGQLGSRSQLTG